MRFFVFCLLALVVEFELFAQCGCSSAPIFIPSMQWLGAADNGLVPKKNLRIALFYRFAASNSLREGNTKIVGDVGYQNTVAQVIASYGLGHYTTLDFDISYAYRRLEQFGFESSGYGFSNLGVGIRQNVFESELSDFVVNFGFGGRMPLAKFKEIESYPIVIQPSTGALGIFAMLYSQKSFPALGLNLALLSKADYNFNNNKNYHFAPSVQVSLIGSKQIFENFSSLVELKGDVRFHDRYHDTLYSNSGSRAFFLVPQLNYKFEDIGLSLFGEIPIYQHFNGQQIGSGFAFGVYINWVINFNKRRL